MKNLIITGEFEGKDIEIELDENTLNEIFELTINFADFINKIIYHCTDQTNRLHINDHIKLTSWYSDKISK